MSDSDDISGLGKLQLIAETVIGYRRKLLDAGMSDDLASRLTERFHEGMMKAMEASLNKEKK